LTLRLTIRLLSYFGCGSALSRHNKKWLTAIPLSSIDSCGRSETRNEQVYVVCHRTPCGTSISIVTLQGLQALLSMTAASRIAFAKDLKGLAGD
jgi:hypothetical protein